MGDRKIMIVDDDLQLVLGLMPRLRAAGYKVISTPDAISAIWVAGKESPNLIILDLGLLGGDGFTVLERMRELPPIARIPVIVLSAREPAGAKQKSLDANAVAYFQKPPDNRLLMNAIRCAMGEAGGSGDTQSARS
jgi:two-component system KDP operon response regulator KdpE